MGDLFFSPLAARRNLIWEWAIPICWGEAGVKVSSRQKNIPRCLLFCLRSCDALCENAKSCEVYWKRGFIFHLRRYFSHSSSLLLRFDLIWRNKECFLSPCFVYRKDYVSDQSKHENYKHSRSSLGCRPDITGLDGLECLVVHLAKGRSRKAAVQGSNSLWSSANLCVCAHGCVCESAMQFHNPSTPAGPR